MLEELSVWLGEVVALEERLILGVTVAEVLGVAEVLSDTVEV